MSHGSDVSVLLSGCLDLQIPGAPLLLTFGLVLTCNIISGYSAELSTQSLSF